MDYRLGNYKKIESCGQTVEITCLKCGDKVNMALFSNAQTKLIPKFPLINTSDVYFLVCPSCSSLFGVDEAKGKTFEKGEKLSIGNFDLKELEKFEP